MRRRGGGRELRVDAAHHEGTAVVAFDDVVNLEDFGIILSFGCDPVVLTFGRCGRQVGEVEGG